MDPTSHSSGLRQSRVVIASLPPRHCHRTRACIFLRRPRSHPKARSHPSQLRRRLRFPHRRNVGRRLRSSHRLLRLLCRHQTQSPLPSHRRTSQIVQMRHTFLRRSSVPVLLKVKLRRKLHRPRSPLIPPRAPIQKMGSTPFQNGSFSPRFPPPSSAKPNLWRNLEAHERTRPRRMTYLLFRLHPHLVLTAATITEGITTRSPNTPPVVHQLCVSSVRRNRVSAHLRRRPGYHPVHRQPLRITTAHLQVQRARNPLHPSWITRVAR
jgi:hypothetical protein